LANNPRELVFRTLLNAERNSSRPIDDLLSDTLAGSLLSIQEKRWTMEMVYGITRMKLQLDAFIEASFKGRYRKAQHAVKVLLRMGTFQLKFMHTADHAAINETVNLGKKVGQIKAIGLINAVLRQVQSSDLDMIVSAIDSEQRKLSVETSHPEWMLERWVSRYTQDDVVALCSHNNQSPQMWIRRNPLKVEQKAFEAYLDKAQIPYERSSILESFYQVENSGALLYTAEFRDGWFSYQNLAAGIVAYLIDPQPNEVVVDVCAAPGGKMAYISELSQGSTPIVACDASSSRLTKVKQAVERLDLKQISIKQLDAAVEVVPEGNKILLDVPCSGTGVLNRRPDARWKRQESDIESLAEIQTKILMNSWRSVLPGGILIYATCTLEPEENWELIDAIIEQLDSAEIEAIKDEKLKPYIDERGALATLPWKHEIDGMFAVKIRKNDESI
jgi:16S rRNA (cytosine967-C5)-methyltransferase